MVWEIALAFFLLICSILILYLIPMVFEFRKTLTKITDVADTLQNDLPEILKNINKAKLSEYSLILFGLLIIGYSIFIFSIASDFTLTT